MTVEEFNVKLRLLQAACPLVQPHILYFDVGWKLTAYESETAEEPLISVQRSTFADAEREYRKAYRRLLDAGRIKPFLVERNQPT